MQPPLWSQPLLSIVFPCLNEEGSLAQCLTELRAALAADGLDSYEIIVADNGSTDRSAAIGEGLGARVIAVPERGYGRALSAGIQAARAPYVIFADADGTYPLAIVPELYRRTLEAGAALGLATRRRGQIERRAMPWLHRWVGTPILTALLNLLHDGKFTDCGTGLRCVQRAWFVSTPHRTPGMEFASENLIRASKSKARVIEIASGLRCGAAKRRPHLRTWRDGMRHLMFILSECPALFERSGLAACVGASGVQAAATWHGPLKLGIFDVFGLHTQVLALLVAVLGSQLYFMGVLLYERVDDPPLRLTKALLRLPEKRLFFSLLGACGLGLCVVFAMIFTWWQQHFSGLSAERLLLGTVHLTVLLGSFSLGLFGAHMTQSRRLLPTHDRSGVNGRTN